MPSGKKVFEALPLLFGEWVFAIGPPPVRPFDGFFLDGPLLRHGGFDRTAAKLIGPTYLQVRLIGYIVAFLPRRYGIAFREFNPDGGGDGLREAFDELEGSSRRKIDVASRVEFGAGALLGDVLEVGLFPRFDGGRLLGPRNG